MRSRDRTAIGAALAVLSAGVLAGCGGSSAAGTASVPARRATTPSLAPSTTAKSPSAPAAPSRAGSPTTARSPAPSPHAFAAAPITKAGAAGLVRSGVVEIPVRVGGPGNVSAFGQALIHGAVVRVANAPAKQSQGAGTVVLTLRLTPIARSTLASGTSILMFVGVSYSKGQVVQRLEVPLRP